MKLRDARLARQLTQMELAQRLNVSQGAVAHWEGRKELPSESMKQRISNVLGMKIDWSAAASPLSVHEQREVFTALEIACRKVGFVAAMQLFRNQDPAELRLLSDLVLRNSMDEDNLLLPPGLKK